MQFIYNFVTRCQENEEARKFNGIYLIKKEKKGVQSIFVKQSLDENIIVRDDNESNDVKNYAALLLYPPHVRPNRVSNARLK